MKTYKDGSRMTIAETDVVWKNKYLEVAVELGSIHFDSHDYELYNERGKNLHDVKAHCDRLDAVFDKDSQGRVDMIRVDYVSLYKMAGRDLFFEALDKGITAKTDIKHFIHNRKKKTTRDPQTLVVLLKSEWYDMIARGEKKEEYRDTNKQFWKQRLYNKDGSFRSYKKIRFQRGYTDITLETTFEGVKIGYGNPEWGAMEGREYFVIKIGDIIR